jgi:hypothetical protein
LFGPVREHLAEQNVKFMQDVEEASMNYVTIDQNSPAVGIRDCFRLKPELKRLIKLAAKETF